MSRIHVSRQKTWSVPCKQSGVVVQGFRARVNPEPKPQGTVQARSHATGTDSSNSFNRWGLLDPPPPLLCTYRRRGTCLLGGACASTESQGHHCPALAHTPQKSSVALLWWVARRPRSSGVTRPLARAMSTWRGKIWLRSTSCRVRAGHGQQDGGMEAGRMWAHRSTSCGSMDDRKERRTGAG